MLNQLKSMIGIAPAETDLDEKLNLIMSFAVARLKNLLGGIDPPDELNYIIVEVANKRFNRIGAEGMTSHSVEGESMTFEGNEFDEFADDIQAFLNKQKDSTRGKVRFL